MRLVLTQSLESCFWSLLINCPLAFGLCSILLAGKTKTNQCISLSDETAIGFQSSLRKAEAPETGPLLFRGFALVRPWLTDRLIAGRGSL